MCTTEARRRLFVFFLLSISLVGTLNAQGEQPVNRNLALLTPGSEISLRLKDEQVISAVQFVSIDEKSLSYKKDGMTVKLERYLVFLLLLV